MFELLTGLHILLLCVCEQARLLSMKRNKVSLVLVYFHGIFKKNKIKSAKRTSHLYSYEPPLPEILDPPQACCLNAQDHLSFTNVAGGRYNKYHTSSQFLIPIYN